MMAVRVRPRPLHYIGYFVCRASSVRENRRSLWSGAAAAWQGADEL